jgi:hypothetical protein
LARPSPSLESREKIMVKAKLPAADFFIVE